ncbi:MAG: hypothetical protein PHV82_10060, partial [Victivallaceae bacterium]|nr:hypothetical protein [Victivallaceae bacterium]
MQPQEWIERNRKYTLTDGNSGFSIAFAGMKFTDSDLEAMAEKFARAKREMSRIEAGEIKNPDENRKVTHFSDRAAYPAGKEFAEVEKFASEVRSGRITGQGGRFRSLIVNGIGGSALGPQLMQFAVNGPYWNELNEVGRKSNLKVYFLDNTDSAGFADVLAVIDPATTLVATVSKSGGTQETRNNMIALED